MTTVHKNYLYAQACTETRIQGESNVVAATGFRSLADVTSGDVVVMTKRIISILSRVPRTKVLTNTTLTTVHKNSLYAQACAETMIQGGSNAVGVTGSSSLAHVTSGDVVMTKRIMSILTRVSRTMVLIRLTYDFPSLR